MATVGSDIRSVEITDEELWHDGPPHEAFKRLRAESPVHWQKSTRGGWWVLSKYHDVWQASLDQKTYSSERHGAIPRDDITEEELAGQREMLISMDPPRHTKYRRLVNLGFSPKMVNRLEQHIRDLANRIIDAFYSVALRRLGLLLRLSGLRWRGSPRNERRVERPVERDRDAGDGDKRA